MIYKNNFVAKDRKPGNNQNTEVIVKLKTTESAIREFSSRGFAVKATNFQNILRSKKAAAMRPLFTDIEPVNLEIAIRSSSSLNIRTALRNEEEPSLSGLNVIDFASEQDAAESITELLKDPNVEYAHIPSIRTFAKATDPDQNRQWALRAIDYFKAIGAAGYKDAKKIRIAILDSGIDPNHPDLKGIVSKNVNFTTLGPNDDSGHGTHVAGIIAAVTNNGIGITGTCASNQIMVLRGLTKPYQGTAYYNAIRYAFNNGAQVLNCSLGGPHDPTEAILMKTAISKGVIVVAAMGNDFQDGNPTSYPAALPDVIAVGASDEADRRGDFSQTGPHIHIMAPGTNILSTVPGYKVALTTNLNYDAWDGTSMATPFVTAAVALMLAKKPTAKLADIKKALAKSALKINGQTAFSNELGHGLLNLAKAIKMI